MFPPNVEGDISPPNIIIQLAEEAIKALNQSNTTNKQIKQAKIALNNIIQVAKNNQFITEIDNAIKRLESSISGPAQS